MALDRIKDGKYSLAEDGGRQGWQRREVERYSGEERGRGQPEWRWDMSTPPLTNSSQLAAHSSQLAACSSSMYHSR